MSSTKLPRLFYALVDCNNFYASCERVFNPKLMGKPIVVLSNNDGCVIARSNEAKAFGIPMGAPFFKYREELERNKVFVFSSNYTLYGQMSQRVMQTLEQFSPEMEIYSIDEAFLKLVEEPFLDAQVRHLKQTVTQWTGIPVSIGVGPTKTLAKAANYYAKKKLPNEGFCILNEPQAIEKLLKDVDVAEVWGIGQQMSALLYRNGIRTAWELACTDDYWIKKNLSVVGLRTVWELRGTSCLQLEEASPPKKSIVCSRSFSSAVYTESDLAEALSAYVATAAEKLRGQQCAASFLEVFLNTNRFKEEEYYGHSVHVTLPMPSDYTPHLIYHAKQGLKKVYREGFAYKKIGVMLGGIVSNKAIQQDLFIVDKTVNPKHQILMQLLDGINAKYGKDALKLAAQGVNQTWKMRRNQCSQHYTTSWEAILQIKI